MPYQGYLPGYPS